MFATALLQLERLASAGDPRAQFEVRWSHLKSLSELDACCVMTQMYDALRTDRGFGSEYYRPQQALAWLRYAARSEDANAQYELGGCFYSGQGGLGGGSGVVGDVKRALALFQAAAAQGNLHARFQLAQLYEAGFAVKRDLHKALEVHSDRNIVPIVC